MLRHFHQRPATQHQRFINHKVTKCALLTCLWMDPSFFGHWVWSKLGPFLFPIRPKSLPELGWSYFPNCLQVCCIQAQPPTRGGLQDLCLVLSQTLGSIALMLSHLQGTACGSCFQQQVPSRNPGRRCCFPSSGTSLLGFIPADKPKHIRIWAQPPDLVHPLLQLSALGTFLAPGSQHQPKQFPCLAQVMARTIPTKHSGLPCFEGWDRT